METHYDEVAERCAQAGPVVSSLKFEVYANGLISMDVHNLSQNELITILSKVLFSMALGDGRDFLVADKSCDHDCDMGGPHEH